MKAKWDLFKEVFIKFNQNRYTDDPVRGPIFEVITKEDIDILNPTPLEGQLATMDVSILAAKYNLTGDEQTFTAPNVDISLQGSSNDWLTKDAVSESGDTPVTTGLIVTPSGVKFFYDRNITDPQVILQAVKDSLNTHLVYHFPVDDITIVESEFAGEYALVKTNSDEYNLTGLEIVPNAIDWIVIPPTYYGTLEAETV